MAEEILVKEVLTEEMKAFGASLTRTLDEAGWPVAASFWSFDPEGNRWELILASPREAYEAVARAIQALNEPMTKLQLTKVVAPENSLVRALALVYQTGATITGIPYSQQAIDGKYIEDGYLYRMALESAAA